MKMQPIKVVEVEGEGLPGLLGQNVTLYCSAYIYTGKLVGVNDTCVKLEQARIVYDTGSFNTKTFTTEDKFPNDVWYVQLSSVESFGILK
jgi:hypothetical protein